MLKIKHTHEDGTVCYTTDSRERKGGTFRIRGKEFIAMWNGYCSMWHVYDTETGYEIAAFRQEFYEAFIEQFQVNEFELIIDPKCN